MASAIQPHNERAAATWGAGGTDYDAISHTIADGADAGIGGDPHDRRLGGRGGWLRSLSS